VFRNVSFLIVPSVRQDYVDEFMFNLLSLIIIRLVDGLCWAKT
jgi:hypothetical protein